MYVFDCGRIYRLEFAEFSPGSGRDGETFDLVARCYLIRHPNGMLLWDSGLPDIVATWYGRTFLWISGLGRPRARLERKLVDQLRDLGVSPSDIRYVAFSHLHTDHVGSANAFSGSTWIVQRREYEAAFSELGKAARFEPGYYEELRNSKRIELDGDHDVFGDGSVVILSTPGHTPGHQSLLVNLPKTGPIVLSGDLWHTQTNRAQRLMPSFNTDQQETLRSMARIEELLSERRARLLIQHDIESNRDVPLSPVYLD
jgi:glyoxylase-like metal-dependent hydrolase (beta-lactamase superfamily II)